MSKFKFLIFIFLFFLLLLLKVKAFSQSTAGTDCSQVLTKAQDTYKEGRIYEIADMLQPCLENGFTKPEKIEAYRLLTLTYLYFNEKQKAEDAMTQLLKNDPEYKLRQSDPTEFVNLYNSFRTTPVMLVGAKFGINFLDVDVIKNFSLDNSAVQRGNYKSNTGIQGGVFAQFPLSKKLSLITELLYSVRKYTYTDNLFGYASLQFPEKQSYIGVPVLLNYNFGTGRWVPYLNLGGSVSYLFSAKAAPVRVDETGGNNQREIKEGEISITSMRNALNFNLIGSAGIKLKDVIGRGYIFAEVRYSYGLNNVVNAKNRYSNSDLMYKYLYIDNNFKLNCFFYSFGYSYPLYKPKLKKVKTKEQN